MSAVIVSKKIQAIERKPVLRAEDVQEVIVAAERSEKGRPDGVSNAEARDIQLFVAKNKKKLDEGAVTVVNAFMMRHNLPYEKNRAPMKRGMEQLLAALPSLPEPADKQPRIGSLQPVPLDSVDGKERVAYYDVVKKEFTVRVGSRTDGLYYGPFAFDGSALPQS